MRVRLARWVLVTLLSLSFVPGALSAPPSPKSKPFRMEAGEGVLLLHVGQNFPVGSAVGYTPPVQLQRIDGDGKKYVVEADATGLLSSMHFVGVLPAGRYRLHDFQPQIGCLVCRKPTLPPNPSMPEVEVRAGEVSYLGTVFLSMKVQFQQPKAPRTVSWAWDDAPDEAIGRRTFAALQPELAQLPVRNGWVGTDQPGLDDRMRSAIRDDAQGMVLGGKYGRDGFYFGAQFGVVKRWRPGGAIEMLDAVDPFFLVSVLETPEGVLLAAGEGGTLRSSVDGGRNWTRRGDTLPYGTVSNLTSIGSGDIAFTVRTEDRVFVYRGRADAGEFDRFADFELKFAFWTGAPGVMPQMFRHGDRMVLTLPSRKFAVLDLKSGASEVLDPPGSIGNFKMNPDGALWCTCARTIAFSPYVSRDYGKTWTASDNSRFMALPEFFDEQRGFSYQGAIFSARKTGVATTTDGGRTWALVHEPDINLAWWQPAYSGDGSVMLLHSVQVFGNLGITLSKYSLDGGATWQRVPDRVIWAHGASPAA